MNDFDSKGNANEEVEAYSASVFDKWILYISSGAFAISLLAMEKLIPTINSCHFWVMLVSWGAFAASIILNLFTQLHNSIIAYKCQNYQDWDEEWSRMDDKTKKNKYMNDINNMKNPRIKRAAKWSRASDRGSLFLLSLGMGMMIAFIAINV